MVAETDLMISMSFLTETEFMSLAQRLAWVKVASAAPPRQALGAFRRNEAPVRPISPSELSDWWK